MKLIYLAALLPNLVLLSACDSDVESEACRYYVQQDMDNSNFEGVINRLENDESCQATYTNNEYYVDLGTAYMGKAGLSVTKVMSAMLVDESDDNDDSSDQFLDFLESVTDSASDSALSDLSRSRSAYVQYLGSECTDIADSNETQDGICLLTGFVDILKTTMAIDAMTGGDVGSWLGSGDITDIEDNITQADVDPMLRSTCALEYAYEHKEDTTLTLPFICQSDAIVEESEEVTFTSDSGVEKTFNNLKVSNADKADYYLESVELGSTIFTKDYCDASYISCDDPDVAGCYSCPIMQEGEDLNIQEFVLDALNQGFDSLDTLVKDNEELQESIDDFKDDIKPGGCDNLADGESCFTLDDILDYLNEQK